MEHKGFTLWLTGMSGAGKSTISDQLMERFRKRGAKVELLVCAPTPRAVMHATPSVMRILLIVRM